MELKLENLNIKKEKEYFVIALIISFCAWVLISLTIFGLVIALGIAVLIWLGNGLLVAQLKSDCIRIDEKQLPALYRIFQDVCQKLNLRDIPQLYVLQAGGFLNAFALRHSGREFVVVYSDILEAYGVDSDEMRFLLGHEIGHLRSRHILKNIILFPGLMLPLLGSAYSRACELSCDRYGAFATQNIEGTFRAMMVLSGGKYSGKLMDAQAFSEQSKLQRGFFVSWYELISGYPTLSQRVAYLIATKDGVPLNYRRHPLAYFFAIFSFGGRAEGIGTILVTVAVIALLAAIAIPSLLRARIHTNDVTAQRILKVMAGSVTRYAHEHAGQYPKSISELTAANPLYLKENYCDKKFAGFTYSCEIGDNNFKFVAHPIANVTGSMIFYVTEEGLFKEEMDRERNP